MQARKTVIDAKKRSLGLNFAEILHYKDLLFILAYRDFRVRYAQTFLGLLWAVIQPILTLLIFILIFAKAVQVDTAGIPYPIYALAGMIGWVYFAYVFVQAGGSIIASQNMVQKVFFPRLIIPLSKSFTGMVDLIVTTVILISMMLYYGITPSSNLIFLPLLLILLMVITIGSGIWMSALTIRYRDFQHVVPFIIQLGLYATPIAYPASMIPEKYQFIYHLNPMAGVVESFRWSILGTDLNFQYLGLSIGMGLIIFITSLFYFRKVEKVMADII